MNQLHSLRKILLPSSPLLRYGDSRRGVARRTTTYKRSANAPPARWPTVGPQKPRSKGRGIFYSTFYLQMGQK